MLYYSIISENCREDAQKYSVQNEIEKYSRKIESDQSIGNWDTFFPEPFVKKNLGSDFRLIAAHVKIEEIILIVFLTIIPRGNTKYHKNPRNYVKQNCNTLY